MNTQLSIAQALRLKQSIGIRYDSKLVVFLSRNYKLTNILWHY